MADSTAKTTPGNVRGTSDAAVLAFKGIPYAAPPTGVRRFRPPEPVAPWPGVRDAIDYGPSCPQPSARPQGWSQEPRLSEDCLYLNVWTPGLDGAARRPVMVWFHGGGFSIGSGSWPVYDGAALARRGDVVVVTVNHRLGIFGYLHLAEVAPDLASSGNAGMLDLVAALQWVRDNIAAFGGDAANVTIFGESGGGAKVSTLHAMPAARGLFHRAIVQSGPGLRVKPRAQAEEVARTTIEKLGVAADPAALQALSTERLARSTDRARGAQARSRSALCSTTCTSPLTPATALETGAAPDVPMVIGCNRDEATLFLARIPQYRTAPRSTRRGWTGASRCSARTPLPSPTLIAARAPTRRRGNCSSPSRATA